MIIESKRLTRYFSQTVSLTQPSPTSTNPAVVAAYSTYSQKCGPDLNTATQAALETYESITSKADTGITDSDFLSWASTGFPAYMQATQDCTNALLDYQDTVSKDVSSGASSAGLPSAPPSSTPPSSAPPSQSSPSSTANYQHSTSATSSSSTPPPPPSQPASAASHGPLWALAFAASGLVTVLYFS